jgi:S1-C subfamily serine protease
METPERSLDGTSLYRGPVPGDLLDVILVVLAAVFAIEGYRQGFIVCVLGCIGFLAGAAIGAAFSAGVARFLVSGPAPRALAAIIVVFITAVIGQLLASLAGLAVRVRVTWRPATLADGLGGAAVSVVSVLLIAWLIGSAVTNAPFSAGSRLVNSSVVLRGVDRFMSPFSGFRLLLDSPYAQFFGALGADGALSVPPNGRVLDSPGLARDRPSIVKIVGKACQQKLQGTGFVFAPHHVLTNAHVVAGVTRPRVRTRQAGSLPARVVLFDPRRDVAVLYVPKLNAPSLRFARHAEAGSSAILAGYPRGMPFTPVPARVGNETAVTIAGIYLHATVTREIYEVRAMVEPGNSGGPLLAPNGDVYGVVFATVVDEPGYGVALTSGEVLPDASTGTAATTPVSTQNCTP